MKKIPELATIAALMLLLAVGSLVATVILVCQNARRLLSEWRMERRWRRTPIVESHPVDEFVWTADGQQVGS